MGSGDGKRSCVQLLVGREEASVGSMRGCVEAVDREGM